MFLLIIVILAISIIAYIIKNKLIIRFDTFFRKGFEKTDDRYGVYCYVGKQGDRLTERLILAWIG